MNKSRNNFVVSNSGGVYKGSSMPSGRATHETEEVRTHNGAALTAGLILVGIIIWAIMNADVIKSAIM